MSKAHPFPTNSSRRAKSPVAPNEASSSSTSGSVTLPLSINRLPSRPMTPNGSSPARPARSDLRPRQTSQYSQSSVSLRTISRDSISTSRSDTPSNGRVRARAQSNGQDEEPQTSPVALSAVMTAFQQAGSSRRRAMTNGTMEREREREKELEEENLRQKRIRDKVPGRRPNGKSRAAGDIDGELLRHILVPTIIRLFPSHSGSDQGRVGLRYRSRCKPKVFLRISI